MKELNTIQRLQNEGLKIGDPIVTLDSLKNGVVVDGITFYQYMRSSVNYPEAYVTKIVPTEDYLHAFIEGRRCTYVSGMIDFEKTKIAAKLNKKMEKFKYRQRGKKFNNFLRNKDFIILKTGLIDGQKYGNIIYHDAMFQSALFANQDVDFFKGEKSVLTNTGLVISEEMINFKLTSMFNSKDGDKFSCSYKGKKMVGDVKRNSIHNIFLMNDTISSRNSGFKDAKKEFKKQTKRKNCFVVKIDDNFVDFTDNFEYFEIISRSNKDRESYEPKQEIDPEKFDIEFDGDYKFDEFKKPKNTEKEMSLEAQIKELAHDELRSEEAKEILKNEAFSMLKEAGIVPKMVKFEVKSKGESKIIDSAHFKFDKVLSCVSARIPVALVGPAGSFKTSTAEKVAEALNLEFYSKSVSVQTGVHEFFGYQDANGNYVTTMFREAYEKGGVFLLDEFDAGNPNVLAALNQATANSKCPFHDGMVDKHEDFVLVMAGNTYGHGANSGYVGRNKIDAATLDRFAFIDFPYDEVLEREISTNTEWFETVLEYRRMVEDKKVKAIISPRATFYGEKLLAQGMDEEDVKELVLFKGLNEQQRQLLNL